MPARWFVDESALGLGKLLARTRDDVVYTGHRDIPGVSLGTPDVDWMPTVAQQGLVAIRRDRRIHTRPAEVRVFAEFGLRTVWLGGKNLAPGRGASSFSAMVFPIESGVLPADP
ncbi:MAG TPA: hypothetical protein VGM60_13395 [Pseudonocardia sp.]|uniref:PIN-like domain-containing protein n=1 Tax=Pseudonocardia sp. TaxID=60912 RepID=UPI002F41A18F